MNLKDLFAWNNELFSQSRSTPLAIQSQRDNILSFQREFNRSINNFYSNVLSGPKSPWGVPAANDAIEPSLDIVENGKEFRISVEAPGVDPNDVEISVSGQYLTITGKKKEDKKEKEENYISHERSFGDFSRTKLLPAEANLDSAHASFRSGIININIPKRADPLEKSKSIAIRVEAEMPAKMRVKSVHK